jgi:hypothetical protein
MNERTAPDKVIRALVIVPPRRNETRDPAATREARGCERNAVTNRWSLAPVFEYPQSTTISSITAVIPLNGPTKPRCRDRAAMENNPFLRSS